jgi:hypothetical protein
MTHFQRLQRLFWYLWSLSSKYDLDCATWQASITDQFKTYDLKFSRRLTLIKPSRAISRVNWLKIDDLGTSSGADS